MDAELPHKQSQPNKQRICHSFKDEGFPQKNQVNDKKNIKKSSRFHPLVSHFLNNNQAKCIQSPFPSFYHLINNSIFNSLFPAHKIIPFSIFLNVFQSPACVK